MVDSQDSKIGDVFIFILVVVLFISRHSIVAILAFILTK